MMKLPILFLLGNALLLSGMEFSIAEGGKANAVIVRPVNADSKWDSDMAFFNREFKRCTGTELPVVKTLPLHGNRIVFLLEKKSMAEEDAYRIDFPDRRTMRISGSRISIRWAVNRILEHHLGIRWLFYPASDQCGPEINHYPVRKNVSVPMTRFEDRPAAVFNRSGDHHINCFAACWNAKMRSPGTHMMTVDVFPVYKYAVGRKWPEAILPVKADGSKTVLPAAEGPLPENPYLARQPYKHSWQPCWSAPETTGIAIENILEILHRNPDKKIINIDVNDMGGYCLCESCRKAVNGRRNHQNYADYSDLYWKWVNNVAAAVGEKHPDVIFSALAYREVLNAPGFKLKPNILPRLCIEISTLLDPETAPKHRKLLQAWSEKASCLDIYDYVFGLDYYLAPRIYFHARSKLLREMTGRYKLHSYYASSSGRIAFHGPQQELMLKMLWNPDMDVDKFLKEWYETAVGKKAAPWLAEYYRFWENYWTGQEIRKTMWYQSVKNVYMQLGERNTHTYALQHGDLKKLRALMEKTVRHAETPSQKKRAEYLMETFTFTELACKAAFSEYIPADGKLRTRGEALALLRAAEEGFQAYADFLKHPLVKFTFDRGKNLLPAAVGAFGKVMPFLQDSEIRNLLREMSGSGKIPMPLRAQFKIWLGAKARNYIPDGSFESRSSAGNWRGAKRDSKHVSDGKHALRIRNGNGLYLIRNIPAGKNYLLLFDVYTDKSSAEGRLAWKIGFGTGDKVGNWGSSSKNMVVTGGAWNTFSSVIHVPGKFKNTVPDHIRIPIWFKNFEPGEFVWVDNVRLYCLDEIR